MGYRGKHVRKPSDAEEEDEFDKLVREQKEAALKNAGIENDEELARKVAEMAEDLEQQSERNYSEIDLIYEKNAKRLKEQQAAKGGHGDQ